MGSTSDRPLIAAFQREKGITMDKYEIFQSECKKIKKENRKLLKGFSQYLASRKLSKKTIDKHVSNIEFYINEFLLYEEPLTANDGVSRLDYFLGYWFIRKALWSSVSSIKEYITSLKHFYTFMHEIGEIGKEELLEMKEDIKESKDEWFETVRRYDDPNTNMDDVWY
jgi:hypothetical protein